MRIKNEFMLHQIGNEYIVMHDGSTQVDFSRIVNLNGSAAYLWQQFKDKDFQTEDLARALTRRYDVDEARAKKDAETFVQSLRSCGILTED